MSQEFLEALPDWETSQDTVPEEKKEVVPEENKTVPKEVKEVLEEPVQKKVANLKEEKRVTKKFKASPGKPITQECDQDN